MSHGLLVFDPSGAFQYTPESNYFGSDSFTYRDVDAWGRTSLATVTLTVQAVNDVPLAQSDAYTTGEDAPLVISAAQGVLTNDSDQEGDPLSATLDEPPSHGEVVIDSDGSFTYTPNADFFGVDSFAYRAWDGQASSPPTTVTIAVTPIQRITIDQLRSAVEGEWAGHFRLRRSGDTSQPLTIPFLIVGQNTTATPGVDFAFLSGTSAQSPLNGSITFAAGSRFADISVVPLADGEEEGTEAVRIELVDQSPTYKLGSPAAASLAIRDEVDLSLPVVTIGRAANELQQVVLPTAGGGTWQMGLGSAQTAALPYGAMNSEVQGALEAIPEIGSGNVSVTGTGTATDPYLIEFIGDRAASDILSLTVDISGLTDVAPALGTVSESTDGVDGANEIIDIVIETPDAEGGILPGTGSFEVYWGPADPTSSVDPRRSATIPWDADVEDIAAAINAIPNIVAAHGSVSVTETESVSNRRRLQVEFLEGLSNRNLNSVNVVALEGVFDNLGNYGTIHGATLQDGARGLTSEVQTVELHDVQGGRFRLEFDGQFSEWIAWDAEPIAVQRALRVIPEIGFWNAAVTGQPGGPWQIKFQGNLGGQNLPPLLVDSTELTGGAAMATTVADGGAALDQGRNAVEGDQNGYLRVYRQGNADEALAVKYIVSAGSSAISGVDFRTLSGTVVIPAGAESATIRIRTFEDTEAELPEDVEIFLADPLALPELEPNFRLGSNTSGIVTILDNDVMGPRPSVSISASGNAAEGGAPGYVRVSRSAATGTPLVVSYLVGAASSAAENDYVPLSGTITIPADATFVDLPIEAIDDYRSEGTENVLISLTGTDQPEYLLDAPTSATVSIFDDEPFVDPDWPVVALVEKVHAQEVGGTGKFRFTRTGNLSQPLTVGYSINEVSAFATIGVDFAYTPGTSAASPVLGELTFGIGQATAEITITPQDDTTPEDDEAVYIRLLESSTDAYSLSSRRAGIVWIRDNDAPPPGPAVATIALVNDTGVSASDKITHDPRVAIGMTGTFSSAVTKVLFDHNGDFAVDGEVIVSGGAGNYEYDPRVTDIDFASNLGLRTLAYQVLSLNSQGQTESFTPWKTFSFRYVENFEVGEVRVVGVRLERDTGELADDLVTANPTLVGSVHGNFAGGTARVELDHGGDQSVDGFVLVTAAGEQFRYDPRAVDPTLREQEGPLVIQYRLVYLDAGQQETVGPWTSVELTLEPIPPSEFMIEGLAITTGIQELDEGEPTLTGQVTLPASGGSGANEESSEPPAENPLSPAFVLVEVDLNSDGAADKRVTADLDGRFGLPLVGIGYGQFTVQVRAVEWSALHGAELYGNWATLTFTLLPEPAPDVVGLTYDYAADVSGAASTQIVVSGSLSATRFELGGILVQFDHNADNVIDGEAIVAADGTFRYAPRQLPIGNLNLRARASRWDSILEDEVNGAWASLDLYVAAASVPSVYSLSLFRDTGESASDGITHVSTLVGELSESPAASGVQIHIDHNGDGLVDGFATPQEDGSFVYDPAGLVPGTYTVRARAALWDENLSSVAVGSWSSLTFELIAAPNDPVVVSELDVLVRTGGTEEEPVTDAPTLVGTLENDGGVGYLQVEFDTDSDGDVDGVTSADAQGKFWYTHGSLPLGPAVVAARAREWNEAGQVWIVGPWTVLEFTLTAPQDAPPVVSTLALASDSGPSATDGLTANAALVGHVEDNRSAANLTVELDHDGDSIVDGIAITDKDGNFFYEPLGLPLGPVQIRARVVEWNAITNSYQRGDWTSLDFEMEAQSDAPPLLVDLQLADPFAGGDPTRSALRGRVTNESGLKDLAVELDFNADGVVDQSALTDQEGRFSLQPNGLAFGTVTIRARTRESHPVSHQVQVSGWSQWSLEYVQLGGPAANVNSLELVNGSTSGTTDPRVTGQLDHAGLGSQVIVQFDHNGDSVPDGQAVAASDLQFSYRPVGLAVGEVTLRARTKDYDHNGGLVYGQWLSLQFLLTESTDQPLVITDLHLANDTGNSATDGSTAEADFVGTLTGQRSSESVTIEIDEDGNGEADSYAGVGTGGAFEFSPTAPTVGLNTVYVRATASSSEGQRATEWTSFSFVFSQDPDGAAAQDLVPVAAALNASATASQAGYQAAVQAAEAAHRQQSAAANQEYDETVDTAIQTRNTAVEGAQQEYDDAVKAADAAYVAALQAAAAALAADLANFGGDTTSFDLQPFQWPDAPAENRATIPDDASQPKPPLTAPRYSGPEFRWQLDPGYQAAKGAFDLAYQQAINAADAALHDAKRNAQDAYDAAARQANHVFREAVADAEQAYRQALSDNSTAPFDLDEEYQNHQERLQDAWQNYNTSVHDHSEAYQQGREGAAAALTAANEAAQHEYDAVVQPAYADYEAVLAIPEVTQEQVRAAWLTYAQIEFGARKVLDRAFADARRQYESTINTLEQTHSKNLATAWYDYQLEVNDSLQTWENNVATYNHWLATRKIDAKHDLEEAKFNAVLARDKSLADAEKIRADAVATAENAHTVAIAVAEATHWTAEINARVSAYAAWDAGENSLWSDYQLSLVQNEADYVASRATAHVTRVTAVASAALAESLAVNLAAKTRSYSKADAPWQRDTSRLAARHTYWSVPASERKERADADADSRRIYADETATLRKDFQHTAADHTFTLREAISEANYNYDVAEIGNRFFIVNSDPYHYAYWGATYSDHATTISHSGERQQAIASAQHAHQAAMLSLSLATGSQQADLNKALDDALRDAWVDEEQDLAEGLATYQKSAAQADKGQAVQLALDEGIERKANALAHVAFVTAQAAADKAFTQSQSLAATTQTVADATDDRGFQVAAALEFVTVLEVWHGSDPTPWSQYQVNLALVEKNRAIAAGDAQVAFVTSVQDAQHTHTVVVSIADEILTNLRAATAKTRTDSIVAAEAVFAGSVGVARLTFAESLADVKKQESLAAIEAFDEIQDDRGAFENTEEKESLADNHDFGQSQNDAWLAYQGSAITAWVTYAISNSADSFQYEQDMEEAYETYRTSVKEAWDVLRTKQAENIRERTAFYGRLGARENLALAERQQAAVNGRSAAEKTLATGIKTHSIELAEAVAVADNVYAVAVADATLAYDASLTTAEMNQRASTKSAEITHTRAQEIVALAQREDTVSARGLYESQVFAAHANELTAAALTEGTSLSAYHASVATADAVLAESLRTIRDAYQDSLSLASYNYTLVVTNADSALAATIRTADAAYSGSVSTAQRSLSIATAEADAELYVASVTAEATHEEQQQIVAANYNDGVAAARTALASELLVIAGTYADAVGEAEKTLYLATSDNWEPGWPGWYGYGSYYGGYYGGWGGYYGGWGGYYGGWGGYYGDGGYWGTDDDSQAYEDYYDALEEAGEDREDSRKDAQVTYVTSIGDAQIARASALGDAEIALATARADAAIAYRTAIQTAETTYAGLEIGASTARRATVLPAELTYSTTVAAGRQAQAGAEKDANVALKDLEGTAAVIARTSRATAEANYQHVAALARAEQLENIAASLQTPQANFDALAADEYADWIENVGPAYISRETAKAYADGLQAYNLAVAWRTRNNSREAANYTFTVSTATLAADRAASEAPLQVAYANSARVAANVRNLASLANKRPLEIAVASAEKNHAVAVAAAEKNYQLEVLEHYHEAGSYGQWYGGYWYGYSYGWYGWDQDAWHTKQVALADADLARVTSVEDAKLTFQKDEATSRKDYSLTLAGAENTRALGLNAIAQSAAVAEAGYQQAVDAVFATSEATYWTAETNAANTHRAGTALADVNFWGAEEAARVTAAQDIDAALDSPWSDFVAAQASAHAGWWTGAAANYLNWIGDRNTSETTWQASINTAHAAQSLTQRTGKADLAVASANATKSRDDALANMRQAYVATLAAPAKSYVDATALAERNYAVAIALARRDQVESNDWDAYYQDLDDATQAKDQALTSSKQAYSAAEAGALAARITVESSANLSHTSTVALAVKNRESADATARRDYEVADSNAYALIASTHAQLDRDYWLYETGGLVAMAASLASSSPSPWSVQYAASQSAYGNWVTGAATAQATKRIAESQGQAAGEIGLANSERDSALASAAAHYNRTLALATAADSAAQAQATMLVLSGMHEATFPDLAELDDFTGVYAIVAADASAYSPNLNADFWGGYWGSYYGGYFGGYYGGYYGFGDWGYAYAGYYGYGWGYGLYGTDYFGYSWTDVIEPAELQLPEGFWRIDEDLADVWQHHNVQPPLLVTDIAHLELVPTELEFDANPVLPDHRGRQAAYDPEEVAAILDALNPLLGAFWRAYGSLHTSPAPERPDPSDLPQPPSGSDSSGHADARPSDSKAQGQVPLTVDPGATSQDIAQQIVEKTQADDPEAPDGKAAQEFQKFSDQRTAGKHSGASEKLTGIEKAKLYLKGLQAADTEEFKRHFVEIFKDVQAYRTADMSELPGYSVGFLKGFFIDGAAGNVTGLWSAAVMGFKLYWVWKTQYSPGAIGGRWIAGDDFATEQEYVDRAAAMATLAHQIMQVIGTELGEQAYEHYRVLSEGTPEELRQLGDDHQLVAAALLGVAAELSEMLKNVAPETKGRIEGAITWEILQTIIEIAFSGGASKTVTATAKFAHIADKLADFGKYAGKFGSKAMEIAQFFAKNGRFQKFCSRLDTTIDAMRVVINMACFTRETLVATAQGHKPIGEIEPGDLVRSFDFATGKWIIGEVVKRHDNLFTGRMVTVRIGPTAIEATAGHPFWVLQGENLEARAIPRELDKFEDEGKSLPGRWVSAVDLRAGDIVLGVDGDHRCIDEVIIRDEAEMPVSNLTVHGCHTFAVGPLAILVHNGKAFCDVYKDALDRLADAAKVAGDTALEAALKARKVASPALAAASKLADGVQIHAHHIVLKTVSWTDRWFKRAPFIEQAQWILKEVDIPLLKTLDDFETKVDEVDDLANMTWALNGEGVHSYDYCKKVRDLLQAAFDNGATKAERRQNVLEALKFMSDTLADGRKFW